MSPEKNTEGTVKSCSGHYLPFKIITFERSENIFDVSLHLVQKKELFLDAEAKEGTLPGRAFSRCSLLGLWTGEKQHRQQVTTSQQFPHGTNLPLSTQPRDNCQVTPSCVRHHKALLAQLLKHSTKLFP